MVGVSVSDTGGSVAEIDKQSLKAGPHSGLRVAPEAEAFASAPSISIDYAVMEKAEHVAVVPVEMGWSDVVCWDTPVASASRRRWTPFRLGKRRFRPNGPARLLTRLPPLVQHILDSP